MPATITKTIMKPLLPVCEVVLCNFYQCKTTNHKNEKIIHIKYLTLTKKKEL